MQITAISADELFKKILVEMYYNGEVKGDPKLAYELVNANLVLLNPVNNTMTECQRKMSIDYAIHELLWYNSKMRTVKSIEKYAPFWKKVSDDGMFVNSNYGYCIHKKFNFDQWTMVKEILQNDKYSKQAVIHIKEARDIIESPTKDLNCTIALQFLIRQNKLYMITTMRSNDVWYGLPYDIFNFTCMQIQMAMELNVDVGTYYHNAASLHLYKKDVEKLKGGMIQ